MTHIIEATTEAERREIYDSIMASIRAPMKAAKVTWDHADKIADGVWRGLNYAMNKREGVED